MFFYRLDFKWNKFLVKQTDKLSLLILLLKILSVNPQCADQNEIILGSGPCTYHIEATANFFTNSSYLSTIPSPIRVENDDFVYLGIVLVNTSESTDHLLLESCWATRRVNYVTQNLTNTIVDFPGCPSRKWRSVVQLNNNGQSDFVSLRFPIFFLLSNEPSFFVHCSVGTCQDCPQSRECDSTVATEQTYTRTAAVVTIGPIERKNFEGSNETQETSKFLIAACILAGLVCIIVLGFLIYCLRDRIKNKKKKDSPEQKKPDLIKITRLSSFSVDNEITTISNDMCNGTINYSPESFGNGASETKTTFDHYV